MTTYLCRGGYASRSEGLTVTENPVDCHVEQSAPVWAAEEFLLALDRRTKVDHRVWRANVEVQHPDKSVQKFWAQWHLEASHPALIIKQYGLHGPWTWIDAKDLPTWEIYDRSDDQRIRGTARNVEFDDGNAVTVTGSDAMGDAFLMPGYLPGYNIVFFNRPRHKYYVCKLRIQSGGLGDVFHFGVGEWQESDEFPHYGGDANAAKQEGHI
jgi:hypothetical protein